MLPRISRSLGSIVCLVAALACLSPSLLDAQVASSLVTTRINQQIDENSRVTLKGTVHPFANRANDRGAAPDSMPLDRMTLFFKRSDTQESSLKKLIGDLHTPGSASYRKWLTPDQFGKQFGPSDQDLATVRPVQPLDRDAERQREHHHRERRDGHDGKHHTVAQRGASGRT